MSDGETTLLQQPEILITTKRAMIRGAVYQIAAVASVRVHPKTPTRAPGIAGLVLVLLGALFAASSRFQSAAANWMMLAGVLSLAFQRFIIRPTYWVRIGRASGEVNAVGFPRRSDAQRVVDALSRAIASRAG